MEYDKIKVFGKLNPIYHVYTINVFAWEINKIYNVRISEFAKTEERTTINLLIEQMGRKKITPGSKHE